LSRLAAIIALRESQRAVASGLAKPKGSPTIHGRWTVLCTGVQ